MNGETIAASLNTCSIVLPIHSGQWFVLACSLLVSDQISDHHSGYAGSEENDWSSSSRNTESQVRANFFFFFFAGDKWWLPVQNPGMHDHENTDPCEEYWWKQVANHSAVSVKSAEPMGWCGSLWLVRWLIILCLQKPLFSHLQSGTSTYISEEWRMFSSTHSNSWYTLCVGCKKLMFTSSEAQTFRIPSMDNSDV